MRIIEIILKAMFLIGGIALIWSNSLIGTVWSCIFLAVCILLGVVLIFNKKHPSYTYPANYRYNNRVIAMRRVEGVILIIFAVVMLIYGY